MKLTANSEESLQSAIGKIRAEYKEHKFLRIQVTTGKDRSLDQNAISHAWYVQVARELQEETPEGVKCECKLRFGVPILRADDEEFRVFYDSSIKKLSYEQKLVAMRYIPITSEMTIKQLSKYLEDMQKDYSTRGVVLEFPRLIRCR